MNYYPFNIGDYAAHTLHLEPLEDLAYRRLLDWYYLNEKPIPLDVAAAARRVRMVDHAEAVRVVLGEFFQPGPDGWTQKRADDEIATMQIKQEANEGREEGKQTRLQRFRQQRSEMFQALQAIGIVPAFNIPMGDLRRLFNDKVGPLETGSSVSEFPSDETGLATGLATTSNANATTLPTPTPTPTPKVLNTQPAIAGSSPAKAGEPADLLGDAIPKTPKPPACPHLDVLKVWAEVMPDLAQHIPSQWKGTRADHLRARWRETAVEKGWTTEADGLAYFRKLFAWCRNSPWLMGKVARREGRAFDFELAWLVNPTNWAKCLEGKYHGQG